MNKKDPPKEATSFAQLLGCTSLGVFYPEENKYVVEVESLNRQATNFFGTLHGGAILGLCDDFCGMLIYHKYGVNSAVTINVKSEIQYMTPVRPTSKLVFTCRIGSEIQGAVNLYVLVTSNGRQIAEMTATWHRR